MEDPKGTKMNRARTPFGAVPISTIYGYEYPLSNNTTVDFNKNESRNRETYVHSRHKPDQLRTKLLICIFHGKIWRADFDDSNMKKERVIVCKDILSTDAPKIHSEYSHSWDYSRSARALSECPLTTTSDVWAPVSNLYYVPTALREARGRSMSPFEWVSSQSPITRVEFPSYPPAEQRSTTISYGGNSPWNSTGFYYSPRYPQAYRGTAATTTPYARRYPSRRFVPSYVPIKYGRRYM